MAEDTSDSRPEDASTSLSTTVLTVATRTIQLVLLGIVGYAVVVGEPGHAVNTGIMLAITLTPVAIRLRYDLPRQPALAFLVATAPFLHAVGAMGPYRNVPAFDQVAHAVSATLVAGLGYVVVRVLDAEYDDLTIPPALTALFVVIFATAFGVAWEILEFATGLLSNVVGGEPLLAQYGPQDVALDLLFNTLGALLVALWGTSYFDGLRRILVQRLGDGR